MNLHAKHIANSGDALSVASTVEGAPAAVTQTASGLVALVKRHPGGALVVFSIVILLVLRYRNSIVGLFNRVPYVGPRAAAFAVGPTSTTTGGA